MSSIHSTGSTGSRRNVYRLGDSTAPLKSRKRRNPCRSFLEKFCAATPLPPWRICSIPCWFRTFERCIKQQSPPEKSQRAFSAIPLQQGFQRPRFSVSETFMDASELAAKTRSY